MFKIVYYQLSIRMELMNILFWSFISKEIQSGLFLHNKNSETRSRLKLARLLSNIYDIMIIRTVAVLEKKEEHDFSVTFPSFYSFKLPKCRHIWTS